MSKVKDGKTSEKNDFTMLRSYAGQETSYYIPRKLTLKQRQMVENTKQLDKLQTCL